MVFPNRTLNVHLATLVGFVSLLLLPAGVFSSRFPSVKVTSTNANTTHINFDDRLEYQMILHGFLLWASVGFLTPIGLLFIRMSNKIRCQRRSKVLFHLHIVLQMSSVCIATVAAILALKNFENNFDNTHKRMGLAVYVLIWLQPLTALCRPSSCVRGKTIWYFLHWLLGTGLSLLAIIDTFVGLFAYHNRTSKSVTTWIISFTVEVSCIVFLYLLQDKWDYLRKEDTVFSVEPLKPTYRSPASRNEVNADHLR